MTPTSTTDTPLVGRRIVFVVNSYSAKSETFLRSKIRGLAQRGADVQVLQSQPNAEDHPEVEKFGSGSVEVHRTALATKGAPQKAIAVAEVLVRHLDAAARGRPDLSRSIRAAELSDLRPSLLIFAFSGLAVAWHDVWRDIDVPVVVSCRGTGENVMPITSPDRVAPLKAILHHVSALHCVSNHMANVMLGYGADPQRVFVNRPAVDLPRFEPRRPARSDKSDPLNLTTVTRQDWVKGLPFALLAVRELVARGVNVKYRLVGSGEDEDQCRWIINDLGVGDHVELVGWKDDHAVINELRHSDAYLLTSLAEGLNNSVLEAMATGIPVVSTDVGGMPEAITHGVDGLLVPSYDHLAIADSLESLANDPTMATRLGDTARSTIRERFTIERQADRFGDVYSALCMGKPLPHSLADESTDETS